MSSVDRSLLAIFAGEQSEHISRIRALTQEFQGGSGVHPSGVVNELLRRLHTLKGAARAVGLDRTEQVVHDTEEMLTRIQREGFGFGETERIEILKAMDIAEDVLEAQFSPTAPTGDSTSAGLEAEPENISSAVASDLVRVSAQSIDDLIRDSSELLVNSNRDFVIERSAAHAARVAEFRQEWQHLRKTTLSARSLSEDAGLKQVAVLLSRLEGRIFALQREAQTVSEIVRTGSESGREAAARLYQDTCQIRMTSADAVLGGFGPMVRDLAAQEGKEIAFLAEGLDTQADRLVLQSIKDPVMHLLRNAVSHGIEGAAERQTAGKGSGGTIRLALRVRGDRLLVAVEDDGRGLNYKAVEQAARKRGLLPGDDRGASREEIAKFLYLPGFSTAEEVTDISGRGIGLSVVQRALARLRGEVEIADGEHGGTRVLLTVPLTISTQHVLLVSTSGQHFGIPASFVESLHRVERKDIRVINGRESILSKDGPVPLVRLDQLLSLAKDASPEASEIIQCAILKTHDRRAAVIVDRLIEARDVVIKDTGLPASALGLTIGAVPLEDGTVAAMLNVTGVLDLIDQAKSTPAPVIAPKSVPKRQNILVVDDSLTTRSLEKSILEAHGFAVQLAVDGLEALERVRTSPPDLVISDVAMPRLTGFQLLERMKSEDSLKRIPVILVTSLESPEEQQLGLSLGADAYIVKRRFDQRELLDVIRQII